MPLPQAPSMRSVFLLYLASNIAVLIFTGIPLFLDLPFLFQSNYYSGDDLFRIMEPLISLPLQLFLLIESRILFSYPSLDLGVILVLFGFGAALYQQGAGIYINFTARISF
jgi:hypothetical protein